MDATSWVIVGVVVGVLSIALLSLSGRSRQVPRANLVEEMAHIPEAERMPEGRRETA